MTTENKILKAVYLVDRSVNHLNHNGVYDIEKARRKAKSYHYWLNKSKREA